MPTQQLQRPLPEPVDDVALPGLARETRPIDDDLPLFIRSIDDPQPAVSQQKETPQECRSSPSRFNG